MQQHPVPRNVTAFQFKLVGDMTLKQFAYLASGAVLGYVAFRVVPAPGVIKFMIGIIFGSIGAVFAFAPVQGRPLDKWLMAFIKSITSPTQFGWKKDKSLPTVMEPSFRFGSIRISSEQKKGRVTAIEMKNVDDKLNSYLANKQQQPHELADVNEKRALRKTNTVLGASMKGALISHQANLGKRIRSGAMFDQTTARVAVQKKQFTARSIHDILQEKAEQAENAPTPGVNQSTPGVDKQPAAQPQPAPMPPITTTDKPTANTEVQILEAKAATGKGFVTASTQPNALSAVVLDLSGKPLPDILVVIKNEHKMIVRALKSNSLGQVVSNTPLSNGTYYIELEDPKGRFIFDIIKATLKGGVFSPIQIEAKSAGNKRSLTQNTAQNTPSAIKSKLFNN